MIITSKIKMDLQQKKQTPVVNAIQNDRYCRNLEMAILEDYRYVTRFLPISAPMIWLHFQKCLL